VLLGSDEKSFYLLYPNAIGKDNRIRANQPVTLPEAGWKLTAGGPPGVDRLLFVVSPSPRDPEIFAPAGSGSAGPFAYSIADGISRQRLLDFFVGRGLKSGNGSMGAERLDIRELP